jgi:hypothetical protein
MIESDNLFHREICSIKWDQCDATGEKKCKKIKFDQWLSNPDQQYERVRNTFNNISKEFILNPQVGTLESLQLKFKEDYAEFSCLQQEQNIEDGDKVLIAYINDLKLTASQCKKLFGIGPSRYDRIKSGNFKKMGSMQSPKAYHEIKLAIFNVFIKIAMQYLSDDNISCLLNFNGNPITVQPNIHDWKSK